MSVECPEGGGCPPGCDRTQSGCVNIWGSDAEHTEASARNREPVNDMMWCIEHNGLYGHCRHRHNGYSLATPGSSIRPHKVCNMCDTDITGTDYNYCKDHRGSDEDDKYSEPTISTASLQELKSEMLLRCTRACGEMHTYAAGCCLAPDHEPPLTADELVGVRGLLQERYNPELRVTGSNYFAGAAASLADGHPGRPAFSPKNGPSVREDKQQDSDSGLGLRHLDPVDPQLDVSSAGDSAGEVSDNPQSPSPAPPDPIDLPDDATSKLLLNAAGHLDYYLSNHESSLTSKINGRVFIAELRKRAERLEHADSDDAGAEWVDWAVPAICTALYEHQPYQYNADGLFWCFNSDGYNHAPHGDWDWQSWLEHVSPLIAERLERAANPPRPQQ